MITAQYKELDTDTMHEIVEVIEYEKDGRVFIKNELNETYSLDRSEIILTIQQSHD